MTVIGALSSFRLRVVVQGPHFLTYRSLQIVHRRLDVMRQALCLC